MKTTIAILALILAGSSFAADSAKGDAPKYDMSAFKTITEDALKLVKSGDYSGAHKKTLELEGKWDEGTKSLKAADRKLWNTIDKQMDAAIEACKAAKDAAGADKATAALNDFLAKLALAEKLK
jgi:hypothetical protein